ncbi:MAG TPA: FeoA family protein [Polyangiaceae bacterium]|jgi:ferrous iron transport protein A|nr:FeoA family protein [Polyangiaceae bacterium]
MTLGDVAIGVPVTVAHVGGDRAFRRRLMELGLLPGTRVEVVRVAPLGDPIELVARGCFLSIRKQDARLVDVTMERASLPETSPSAIRIQPGLPASS